MKSPNNGFSLIECLISLSLFLVVFLGSMEIYNMSRQHFIEIKNTFERQESTFATLDKIRIDIKQAGKGLLYPLAQELLTGIQISDKSLEVFSSETCLNLNADLQIGQTRIDFPYTHSIKKNRQICIVNSTFGEIVTVVSVSSQSIVLDSPLQHVYPQDTTQLIVLRKVTFYLDEASHVLRRKVNTSPAQPLLEDASLFAFSYDAVTNLVNIQLALLTDKEIHHETDVFPKNLRLVELSL